MKYPKLSLFLATIFVAYQIFVNKDTVIIQNTITSLGYFGAFIAGILYAYGFTSTIATSIFLILGTKSHLLLSGFIASIGAFIGNIIIYLFVTHTLEDEIKKLSKEKIIVKINKFIKSTKLLPKFVKKYILIFIAFGILASPLPNEIGITILAASKKILPHEPPYILLYVVEAIGILLILLIGYVI